MEKMHNPTGTDFPEAKKLSGGRIMVRKESVVPFLLLLFYLFMEYGRSQSLIPFLRIFRLSGISIVLLALFVALSGRLRLKDKQTIFFLFLLGLMVVHGPIAVNNYWALMIFIDMAFNFIVYLSLIHFVDNQDKYNKLVTTWIGIHLFLAAVGIIKGGRGIGGFLGDENDLCMTLNMVIPFTFFLSFNETGSRKVIYLIITCVILFVIILTKSRGGFVGLTATCVYCWFRTDRKVLTAALVGILALFVLLMAPSSYWDEVHSIGEQGTTQGTGAQRIYTWGIGWHIFLDNPIIGVGQGNFQYVFKKYEFEVTGSDEPYLGRSVAGRAAHSIYFTMLPELGIVGVIIFFGMTYLGIKDLRYIKKVTQDRKKMNPNGNDMKQYNLSFALEGSLVAYLISGAFISVLYYPNFWILMGLIISLKNIVNNSLDKSHVLSDV